MQRRTLLKGGLAALALAGTAGSSGLLRAAFASRLSLPLVIQPVIAAGVSQPNGGGFATPLPIPDPEAKTTVDLSFNFKSICLRFILF